MIIVDGVKFNCKRHPTYKAIRYPYSGCLSCRVMWPRSVSQELAKQGLVSKWWQRDFATLEISVADQTGT